MFIRNIPRIIFHNILHWYEEWIPETCFIIKVHRFIVNNFGNAGNTTVNELFFFKIKF